MGRAAAKRKASLVKAYAERIPRKALEMYREAVKRVIGRKSGIYVLSKGSKLYYVGVARKLPSRLREHLTDHHRKGWDWFSFYRIPPKYLKQIEAILIRVARPSGNRQRGSFGKRKNVRKRLIAQIKKSAASIFQE